MSSENINCLIDSHCHINSDELRGDADAFVRRAADAGVFRMLTVGCTVENSAEAVNIAERFSDFGVYASVGVHPHEAKSCADGLPDSLLKLASHERVVAVGEAGLDYFYDHSPRDVQRRVFIMHIEWARRAGLPLILHIRDGENASAMKDALAILREHAQGLPLLFHCYAGGLRHLDDVLSLGAMCAIGGAVTWKNSTELREVAARIPADRLLVETDCPWMAPKPFRGKLNEPSFVRYAYETIAEVRGIELGELARIAAENADRLFGWGTADV